MRRFPRLEARRSLDHVALPFLLEDLLAWTGPSRAGRGLVDLGEQGGVVVELPVLVVQGAIKGVYEGDEALWRNTLELYSTLARHCFLTCRLTCSFTTSPTGSPYAPVLLRPVP